MSNKKNFFAIILYPFKWIAKKIRQTLQYVLVDKTNKVFLILIPNLLFTILGVSILFYNFRNMEEDTTSLTNYGFAILAGISSLCFSWARGLNKDEDAETLKKVTIFGESFFHCAIIFLLLSAIKYATLHLDLFFMKNVMCNKIIYFTLSTVHLFGFSLGFYKVNGILCELNELLYERTHIQ